MCGKGTHRKASGTGRMQRLKQRSENVAYPDGAPRRFPNASFLCGSAGRRASDRRAGTGPTHETVARRVFLKRSGEHSPHSFAPPQCLRNRTQDRSAAPGGRSREEKGPVSLRTKGNDPPKAGPSLPSRTETTLFVIPADAPTGITAVASGRRFFPGRGDPAPWS